MSDTRGPANKFVHRWGIASLAQWGPKEDGPAEGQDQREGLWAVGQLAPP